MNTKKLLCVCLLFSIFISACTNKGMNNIQHHSLQKSNYSELASSVNKENVNVEMQVEHPISEVKTDKLLLQIMNNGEPLSFGASYEVEIFKDGSWYAIPFKDDSTISMIGIKLDQGKTYKSTISLKALKYDLMPGQYRVIKSFSTGVNEITLATSFKLK